MKQLLRRFTSSKVGSADNDQLPSSTSQPNLLEEDSLPSPTANDIVQYRYQHGVNLGSAFVLEQWLHPSMFVEGIGGSELDAVSAFVSQNKNDARLARTKWEQHWSTYLEETSLDYLESTACVNSIRLPIGYWCVPSRFFSGTPFAPYAQVYGSAWTFIRETIQRFWARGIGVLLDLHALPGGANSDSHSGTSTGKAELWTSSTYQKIAIKCFEFIAREARSLQGIIGIQICNEAQAGVPNLQEFYDSCIAAIARVDSSIPIYVSDAWDLSLAISHIKKHNTLTSPGQNELNRSRSRTSTVGAHRRSTSLTSRRSTLGLRLPSRAPSAISLVTNPIVIDTHCYYTFSEAHRSMSPEQIIAGVPESLDALSAHLTSPVHDRKFAAAVIVGEWSCVLDTETWNLRDPHGPSKEELVQDFAAVQLDTWQRHAMGNYFWTFHMDWMPGGEWGFIEQNGRKNIVAPEYMRLSAGDVRQKLATAAERKTRLMQDAVQAHEAYWNQPQHRGNGYFEHWRFSKGWDVGWDDAAAFYAMRGEGLVVKGGQSGADRIGSVDLWVRKTLIENGVKSDYVWEFEAGLRQGISAFERTVGIV